VRRAQNAPPCTQPKLVGYLVSDSLRDSGRGLLAVVAASMGGVGLQYVPSWRKPQHETNCGAQHGIHLRVGMDSDQIRTNTNSDVTIYHILFRIRIRMRILSNANTKWIFRIRICIQILTRFIALSHNEYQFYLSMVL
jgi:hypothetical protein